MKYEIKGGTFPIVICQLEDGEQMITEKGAMIWMTPNMQMETVGGGVGKMFSKALSGESMFQNIYTSKGAGEQLVVDTGNVAGFDSTVSIDIRKVPGLKNMIFGGEGLFNTVLTGPGKVWLQTMPIVNVAGAIQPYIVTAK